MLRHSIHKHTLQFKRPSGTSRGVLRTKDSWFLKLWNDTDPTIIGIGECSIIGGLSPDPISSLVEVFEGLTWSKNQLSQESQSAVVDFPAIQFAIETALQDLKQGGHHILFPSSFTEGSSHININGLIWMGDRQYMKDQIRTKIDQGYRCVKMKIGAIDFQTELDILKGIRAEFSQNDIELRVDANGAFSPDEALTKLEQLSAYDLHSIEQPIRQGQPDKMGRLCEYTPLPIALDEELIGLESIAEKKLLLYTIYPQYIILKPSLLGGFSRSQEWITIAEENEIGWWVTSALESNIGLNAIAQWTATLDSHMFQGLGTGQLYINNIQAPLKLEGDKMFYDTGIEWDTI